MGRRLTRFMTEFEKNELQKAGTRLEDVLRVLPMVGRTKELSLKRTKYDFYVKKVEGFLNEGTNLCFPAFDQRVSHYQLLLINLEKQNDFNEDSRYLLRTMTGAPFKINGNYSFESFISRGDRVDLGLNRIEFKSSDPDIIKIGDEELATQLIESKLNIVLQGETGTGKSRLARMIHEKSLVQGNFVHINIQALSSNLIESELFGHAKGAFTGATYDKKGAFRSAHLGTLFLDEIDSLPLELQTKLLLFLDDQNVRPVGAERSFPCQVRLIFASGKPLQECVNRGEMRQDFYYRLTSGAVYTMPSLRENREMIRPLIEEFCLEKKTAITERLMTYYQALDWPGNIRQLRAHLDKKRVLARGKKIDFCQIDEELKLGPYCHSFHRLDDKILSLEEMKKIYCERVYQRFSDNIKTACKVLEISPNTLRNVLFKKTA